MLYDYFMLRMNLMEMRWTNKREADMLLDMKTFFIRHFLQDMKFLSTPEWFFMVEKVFNSPQRNSYKENIKNLCELQSFCEIFTVMLFRRG